jgi:hypothetical protein
MQRVRKIMTCIRGCIEASISDFVIRRLMRSIRRRSNFSFSIERRLITSRISLDETLVHRTRLLLWKHQSNDRNICRHISHFRQCSTMLMRIRRRKMGKSRLHASYERKIATSDLLLLADDWKSESCRFPGRQARFSESECQV